MGSEFKSRLNKHVVLFEVLEGAKTKEDIGLMGGYLIDKIAL